MLLVKRVEIHGGPGSGAVAHLDDCRDKLLPLTGKTRQQGFGLDQVFETVFGVKRIARCDHALELQLHQQRLERQLAQVAVVRQRPQQELPLPVTPRRLQRLQHTANARLFRGVAVHEVFQHIQAVPVGQHQAVGRLTIPPCTADFLAVVLDGLGQVEMHHVADVTLVDAHAKRDGGNDAIGAPAHKALLDALALIVGQAGVIGLGLNAMAVQVLGNLFSGFLQRDIDDTRLMRPLAHPGDQAPTFVRTGNRFHQQVEVGPVEACGDDILRCNGELRLHVGNHLGRGRGRQQQGLWDIELALVVRQLQIVRAKVMAPFGNTVRLVHHQQRNLYALQEMTEALVLQTLHGNHQDFQLARACAGHHVIGVIAALRRIDTAG